MELVYIIHMFNPKQLPLNDKKNHTYHKSKDDLIPEWYCDGLILLKVNTVRITHLFQSSSS